MSKKRQHPKYESITARWGGMDIRYDFGSRIDTWLNAFHEDEKKLALSLLKHFFYYSENVLRKKLPAYMMNFVKDAKIQNL